MLISLTLISPTVLMPTKGNLVSFHLRAKVDHKMYTKTILKISMCRYTSEVLLQHNWRSTSEVLLRCNCVRCESLLSSSIILSLPMTLLLQRGGAAPAASCQGILQRKLALSWRSQLSQIQSGVPFQRAFSSDCANIQHGCWFLWSCSRRHSRVGVGSCPPARSDQK